MAQLDVPPQDPLPSLLSVSVYDLRPAHLGAGLLPLGLRRPLRRLVSQRGRMAIPRAPLGAPLPSLPPWNAGVCGAPW